MKLTIRNFQAHENSVLEFKSPGINTITGRNSHGKSSIMRAARVVALGGAIDRRHGTKESSVDIDGCAREYKGGKNQHVVPGVKAPLKALRTGVPPQVTDKLKLTEVNFRDQHEAYFLLSDSPGSRTRTMNTLADLGVIDYVAAAIKSEGRDLEAERKVLAQDLDKAKKELASTDWAIQANTDLQAIEETQQKSQEINSQKLSLQELISQIRNLHEKLATFPPPAVLSRFLAAKHATDRTEKNKLQALIADVLGRQEWLQSLPKDMTEPLKSHRKRLSELPEVSSLATLCDRLAEYQEDIRLCPDPKPDIIRLRAISLEPVPENLVRAVEAATAQTLELRSYDGLEGWETKVSLLNAASYSCSHFVEGVAELKDPVVKARILRQNHSDLAEQCTEAKADLNSAFAEAGKCPLCGADCGGRHE